MKNVYLFDLDSTITKEEILPTIAKSIGKEKEMQELTEKTMMGELDFVTSFKARVKLLSDIPVDEVATMISNIKLNSKLVEFLNEHYDNSYIVTGNLDVWIEKLMIKIGMQDHCLCSKAKVVDNKIVEIDKILDKVEAINKFSCQKIAIGDGSNDYGMLKNSDIGVGFGEVRKIAPMLFDVINYAVYDENKLCDLLNMIELEKKPNKTVIIPCAGMGKRLGRGMPKALIEISNQTLISRTLQHLDNLDIRVVVGYQAENVINEVNKYRKDIIFVFNHDYMNNGTAASIALGAKYAGEYIITIDGDIIIHPDDIKDILNSSVEFVGVCTPSTDNPVLAEIQNDKVVNFSREIFGGGIYLEWTGISQFKNHDLSEPPYHVYQILEPFLPLDYKKIRIREIDTEGDFEEAVRWLNNNYDEVEK